MTALVTGRVPRSGYSRFVELMRWLLPALALALAVLIAAWPQMFGGLTVPGVSVSLGEPMTMTNPRYVGRTDDSRPFAVEADTALLDPAEPDRIALETMRADLGSTEGRDLSLAAGHGVYDRGARVLDLDGGVEVGSSDGYVFRSPAARVELDKGRVAGQAPIEGEGPPGSIRADRFEFTEGGDRLHFEGRVRVTVLPTADAVP